jgi:hypothetical protein
MDEVWHYDCLRDCRRSREKDNQNCIITTSPTPWLSSDDHMIYRFAREYVTICNAYDL